MRWPEEDRRRKLVRYISVPVRVTVKSNSADRAAGSTRGSTAMDYSAVTEGRLAASRRYPGPDPQRRAAIRGYVELMFVETFPVATGHRRTVSAQAGVHAKPPCRSGRCQISPNSSCGQPRTMDHIVDSRPVLKVGSMSSLVVLETAGLVSRPKFCSLRIDLVAAGLVYNTEYK